MAQLNLGDLVYVLKFANEQQLMDQAAKMWAKLEAQAEKSGKKAGESFKKQYLDEIKNKGISQATQFLSTEMRKAGADSGHAFVDGLTKHVDRNIIKAFGVNKGQLKRLGEQYGDSIFDGLDRSLAKNKPGYDNRFRGIVGASLGKSLGAAVANGGRDIGGSLVSIGAVAGASKGGPAIAAVAIAVAALSTAIFALTDAISKGNKEFTQWTIASNVMRIGLQGVGTSAKQNEINLRAMQFAIADLSKESKFFSQTDLARSIGEVVKAGRTSADALDIVSQATNVAATEIDPLTGKIGDLTKAALVMNDVLQSYASTGIDAAKASDILAAGALDSKVSMSELATSAATVGGVATQFGLDLSDVIAFLVKMTNSGYTTSRSVTFLRGILTGLNKDHRDIQPILDEFGITLSGNEKSANQYYAALGGIDQILKSSNKDMNATNLIFKAAGGYHLNASITAGKHSRELEQLAKKYQDANGTAKEFGASMTKGVDKMLSYEALVSNLRKDIGEQWRPILNQWYGEMMPKILEVSGALVDIFGMLSTPGSYTDKFNLKGDNSGAISSAWAQKGKGLFPKDPLKAGQYAATGVELQSTERQIRSLRPKIDEQSDLVSRIGAQESGRAGFIDQSLVGLDLDEERKKLLALTSKIHSLEKDQANLLKALRDLRSKPTEATKAPTNTGLGGSAKGSVAAEVSSISGDVKNLISSFKAGTTDADTAISAADGFASRLRVLRDQTSSGAVKKTIDDTLASLAKITGSANGKLKDPDPLKPFNDQLSKWQDQFNNAESVYRISGNATEYMNALQSLDDALNPAKGGFTHKDIGLQTTRNNLRDRVMGQMDMLGKLPIEQFNDTFRSMQDSLELGKTTVPEYLSWLEKQKTKLESLLTGDAAQNGPILAGLATIKDAIEGINKLPPIDPESLGWDGLLDFYYGVEDADKYLAILDRGVQLGGDYLDTAITMAQTYASSIDETTGNYLDLAKAIQEAIDKQRELNSLDPRGERHGLGISTHPRNVVPAADPAFIDESSDYYARKGQNMGYGDTSTAGAGLVELFKSGDIDFSEFSTELSEAYYDSFEEFQSYANDAGVSLGEIMYQNMKTAIQNGGGDGLKNAFTMGALSFVGALTSKQVTDKISGYLSKAIFSGDWEGFRENLKGLFSSVAEMFLTELLQGILADIIPAMAQAAMAGNPFAIAGLILGAAFIFGDRGKKSEHPDAQQKALLDGGGASTSPAEMTVRLEAAITNNFNGSIQNPEIQSIMRRTMEDVFMNLLERSGVTEVVAAYRQGKGVPV
jgi:TP901 family phage tail tape measure protein